MLPILKAEGPQRGESSAGGPGEGSGKKGTRDGTARVGEAHSDGKGEEVRRGDGVRGVQQLILRWWTSGRRG